LNVALRRSINLGLVHAFPCARKPRAGLLQIRHYVKRSDYHQPIPHQPRSACVPACVRSCVHEFLRLCVRAFVHSNSCICAFVRLCLCACVSAFIFACVRACVFACMHVCVRACVHACVSVCMHARTRICMRACVRACERACVRAYVRACLHARACSNCLDPERKVRYCVFVRYIYVIMVEAKILEGRHGITI
jgi:hypothetical protein